MEKYFCNGKKDFCDNIENCDECQFLDGSGVISSEKIDYIFSSVFGKDYDLSRLRELVQADREERCVVLPCKAGNTITAFRFQEKKGLYRISDKVTSVSWNKNGWTVRTKEKFYPIKEKDRYDFAPISEYPKALADFYIGSEQEAEAALKGRKQDES